MDAEKSEVSETQKQEETVVEKEVNVETTEPENPPAAAEEAGPQAADVASTKEMEEPVVVENKDVPVEDKSDKEPEPSAVAPPESAESSQKVSDPVAALGTKPESTEQQPVPENEPEPLQTHQAESAPEPEPGKPAELVPEAGPEEKTLPAPAAVEPPIQEKEAPEPVKAEDEPRTTAEAETVKEAPVEAVLEKVVSSEKPAEAPAEVGSGEPAKDQKEAKSESVTPVEAEGVKSEQKDAEPPKEENVAPASGSLSFAILEQDETKDALRISRTLVVLRGLPGSGKSFLARAIADAYKDQCSVFCADNHGIKPENPKSSADGYKALDEAVAARCREETTSSVLVVVDDTNHTHDRLGCLGEIAKEHNLVALFLEPQTEWSRDSAQLKEKSGRELEEAQLEAMKVPLEDTSLPLYYGWFLLSSVQEKVKSAAMGFLKTLESLDDFKNHLDDFAGKSVELEQYFEAKAALHCTTKFCNYGKAAGAKEYAQNPAVVKSYGSVFELSLTALFITPRTVGARVSLTEEQLHLWPADGEKEVESDVPAAASLPPGSRAHVTLGCAEGVQSVQTGIDLLQILALQQAEAPAAKELELGSLRYYGEGRWMLELKEPVRAPACFSSFYGRREVEPTKKEHEKKKKLKCAIL
ncbi:2',3'-cyclic-nucleotide 3'-phosphodiesterase [Kryptolebias marmoratus]|uniref:2',3'-cyclic-nucleotide 3'-phosphodiesterase n=1 Tax=Kryptolebias marmoratus TaxID=37003 RepID=A0A3Q3BND8_KRYMA|nr:2',3'-cyclic-nucleotide 3'-phosphodiesterase [Kryptolebias marmoratus]